MNARAARAIRRDLRRTVGEDGIEALTASTNALNNQVFPNLNALQARFYDVTLDENVTAATLARDRAAIYKAIQDAKDEVFEANERLGKRLSRIEAVATHTAGQHDSTHAQIQSHINRSLWQRLRWLVLGR